MATAHEARGHETRVAGTMNAGQQAYDRGKYRFKSRATLFLHLAPENSLKPYLGPDYGATHVYVQSECLTADLLQAPPAPSTGNMHNVVCVFGQQTSWQGGYGGAGLADLGSDWDFSVGIKTNATVETDGGVSCISPDMTGQTEWQQLAVYRYSDTWTEPERVSHAMGFYLYPHAPERKAGVQGDLRRWRRSSVFSHRQGPALTADHQGNQFEHHNRRKQNCPDPDDIDC
jgi:hypothetical protein